MKYAGQGSGLQPLQPSENIFGLLGTADERIGEIESILFAITQKVVGNLQGVEGIDDEPRPPDLPSIRSLGKQNNERLSLIRDRLKALATDLGV